MSNLNSFSTLREHVNRIHKDLSFEKTGEAFDFFSLKTILKITDDEVIDSITDGGHDGGLDAIYIKENEVHLFNCKYTEEFENTKKNFPAKEVADIIVTIGKIISGNLHEDDVNTAVWEKYIEIRNLFKSGTVHFKLYLVSNKEKLVHKSKDELERSLEQYRFIKCFYYDQEDLVNELIENDTKKINGALTFLDKTHFEKSDGNIKTVIGVVAASDIIELIKKDDESVDENIFNENIRVYKPSHRINKEIIESAISEDNYSFFYLNNGVTILCDECDYMPNSRSPRTTMKNIQIINGGQTTHSLFEASKKNRENVDNVEVLVRLCILKDNPVMSSKISETSNNQIPVGTRDLHSNDKIQLKLEKEFSALGYCYERKPNKNSNIERSKVISNELLGQLYLSYELNKASEAKNKKSIVFTSMYDEIFDEDKITAKDLLNIYKIYLPLFEEKKKIQSKKRKKEKITDEESYISFSVFHLLNICARLIRYKEFEIRKENLNKNQLEKALKDQYLKENINELIIKSKNIMIELIKKEKAENDDYSHDKFFKEALTNKKIEDAMKKYLEI